MFSVAPISQNNVKSSSTNWKGCASLIQAEIFEFLSLQIREIYQDSRIQFIFLIFLHFLSYQTEHKKLERELLRKKQKQEIHYEFRFGFTILGFEMTSETAKISFFPVFVALQGMQVILKGEWVGRYCALIKVPIKEDIAKMRPSR